MTLVNTDSAQDPVVFDDFSLIEPKSYPFCLLGFQLKNNYDQQRLKLKQTFKVKDYIHLLPVDRIAPVFFRGIELDVLSTLKDFLDDIGKLNLILDTDTLPKVYINTLKKYNLTCEECFGLLQQGVYPIDIKHLSKISDISLSIDELYSAFNTSKIPVFQAFGSFTIFILTNTNVFNKKEIKQFFNNAEKL
jgi:hypothetical protein